MRGICLMWDGWVVSNPNRRAGVRTVFVSSAHGTVVSALALCVGCESFEPRGGARCDLERFSFGRASRRRLGSLRP